MIPSGLTLNFEFRFTNGTVVQVYTGAIVMHNYANEDGTIVYTAKVPTFTVTTYPDGRQHTSHN